MAIFKVDTQSGRLEVPASDEFIRHSKHRKFGLHRPTTAAAPSTAPTANTAAATATTAATD
jgi:hypothetical protein